MANRTLSAPLLTLGIACLLTAGCSEPSEESSATVAHVAPPAGTAAPPTGPWFTDVTTESGLDFVHRSSPVEALHLPAVMAGGAALFDFDNDGDLDIYLTNGSHIPESGGGPDGPTDRLYRREPDGRYTDVTDAAVLADPGFGMGVAAGDVDNDGWVDLFVTGYGFSRLYRNRGDGSFEDVSATAAGVVDGWSASAAFCDFDRDGRLDLYVTRYVDYLPSKRCTGRDSRPDFCGPTAFRPVPDVLLRNETTGAEVRFRDVSRSAGIADTAAAGLGVVCLDADGDGWQDVYVANDGDPNQLWMHQGATAPGGVAFRDDSLILGVAYNLHGQAQAGMGVVADDLDGDGTFDLFLTHLMNEANTFYGNLGGAAGFQDRSGATGLGPASMPFTGFGVAALDVELDGDLDLVIANGKVNVAGPVAGADYPPPWDTLPEPLQLYLNSGGRFSLLKEPARAFSTPPAIGRAIASGDLDGDGDVDLLVANLMGPARLYRNDAPRRGHWLGVRALDPLTRRDAIGAGVTLVAGEKRHTRQVTASYGYLASHATQLQFGLGETAAIDRIEVRWPNGDTEVFPGGAADRVVTVRRGEGDAVDG